MRQMKSAVYLSILLGSIYILVYQIDLTGVFPKSPTKMSKSLMLMEIVNTMMSVLLIILSLVTISYIGWCFKITNLQFTLKKGLFLK